MKKYGKPQNIEMPLVLNDMNKGVPVHKIIVEKANELVLDGKAQWKIVDFGDEKQTVCLCFLPEYFSMRGNELWRKNG